MTMELSFPWVLFLYECMDLPNKVNLKITQVKKKKKLLKCKCFSEMTVLMAMIIYV